MKDIIAIYTKDQEFVVGGDVSSITETTVQTGTTNQEAFFKVFDNNNEEIASISKSFPHIAVRA